MAASAAPLRVARVDLDAIRRNVARLPAGTPADVSADAFGHGLSATSRAALEGGADKFLVRSDSERAHLHAEGITVPVLVRGDVGGAAAARLYGVDPVDGFEPAMRVSARVISLKTIAAGEPVSYGYTWRAARRTNLALVPLGYADGVSRSAGNRASVRLGGVMRPIVGRVAMDVIVVDLGDDDVELGAEADLFGSAATASEWGRSVGMVGLEVTSAIGSRVTRVYP